MWILEKIGDTYNVPVKQYLVTSTDDISELPAGALGDKAIVIDTGQVIYYNPEKGWPKIK